MNAFVIAGTSPRGRGALGAKGAARCQGGARRSAVPRGAGDCHRIAIGLPSDCHRIAIGLPSDCHRIAIDRLAPPRHPLASPRPPFGSRPLRPPPQLSKSELHAAAHLLHGCLRTAWLCNAGDALRRWVYYAASGPEPTFPGFFRGRTALGTAPPAAPTTSPSRRRAERVEATSPSLSPPARHALHSAPPAPPPPLTTVPERRDERHCSSTASASFAAANMSFTAAVVAGGGAAHPTGAARRTARLLELTRVVWLSPLGGGACLRALWRWQQAARDLASKELLEESKRLRYEVPTTTTPRASLHPPMSPHCPLAPSAASPRRPPSP